MIRVLCYGDSNTWGYDPATSERYPPEIRWTGVLQQVLGREYTVIEEGLNGRTTVWDDPIEGCKNGRDYLIPCLETHRPLDLVLILLGTNDLKMRFSLSALDIAQGVGVLVEIVRRSGAGRAGNPPLVLLLAPPPVGLLSGDHAEEFYGAENKSRLFATHYRRIADEQGVAFFDTGGVITSSDQDGIHLEPEAHHRLADALAPVIADLIKP